MNRLNGKTRLVHLYHPDWNIGASTLDNKTTIEADDAAAAAEDNGLLLHITLQMAIMTMLSSQSLDFVIFILHLCAIALCYTYDDDYEIINNYWILIILVEKSFAIVLGYYCSELMT